MKPEQKFLLDHQVGAGSVEDDRDTAGYNNTNRPPETKAPPNRESGKKSPTVSIAGADAKCGCCPPPARLSVQLSFVHRRTSLRAV